MTGKAEGEEYQPTPRQLDIIRGIAAGKKNRAIGAALYISEDTVKTHLAHLMTGCGIHDRAGVVAWALRRELIT